MVGAGAADGDENFSAFSLGVGENELELPHLVSAVELRASVVSFDIKVGEAYGLAVFLKLLDWSGEVAQLDPREFFELGVCLEDEGSQDLLF